MSFTVVLLSLAPYIVPILITLLAYGFRVALEHLPSAQRPLVESVVRSGVSAAEQMASDQLNGPGKKQLAIELVEKQLAHYGVKVPDSVVNSLIEEAVLALKQAKAGKAIVPLPLPPNK